MLTTKTFQNVRKKNRKKQMLETTEAGKTTIQKEK